MKNNNNIRVNIKPGIRLTSVLFVLVVLVACLLMPGCVQSKSSVKQFETLEDLRDCRFALSDSNVGYEPDILKDLPDVKIDRYTNYFDTFIAVANGNEDAAFTFKYTFIGLQESYPDLGYVEGTCKIPIVANFSKDADVLREDFNKFIAESRQNGLLDQLADKWMYRYEELGDDDVVEFDELEGTNGSFKLATSSDVLPYEYFRGGKHSGYEAALVYEFCKARGYKPEIIETRFDAVVAGVSSGKYDMGLGAYGYTGERAENSHFSDPYFDDVVVYTVNRATTQASLLDSIKGGFERTFVRQDRWKLFADGLLVTLLVTVMAVVMGSVLGFLIFLASRRSKVLTRLSLGINDTLEALPVLVVLMMFFYVIFGKSSISGSIVSIIVFGLYFTFTFFALMNNSVRGVPYGQTEAGLALGYTPRQTLVKVVLPQAMDSFIPAIRSAIISTLKGTAVVGYVAVQDLTKAGDLIRSQTFDAFLPIITVALLYFVLAKILIILLNRFLVTPDERRARKEGR